MKVCAQVYKNNFGKIVVIFEQGKKGKPLCVLDEIEVNELISQIGTGFREIDNEGSEG